ncbi:hypothetical protein RJ55_03317 [Drechmeria coniospora]|nr:hypothetical protein RJ55_03317 [Drechmeria coniospora]
MAAGSEAVRRETGRPPSEAPLETPAGSDTDMDEPCCDVDDAEKGVAGSSAVTASVPASRAAGGAGLGGKPGSATDDAAIHRAASRSSTRSRALTVVPRHERRGLLGRFSVVPEVKRPYDYRHSTKWGITATISLAAMAAPLGSSIFYPALPVLTDELGATPTMTNLSVAMYMLSMSVFPLWWSSFSEQFGRRSIYLISFALFVVFSILCAVSTNIATLVVFRILTGGASASVQAVGAGTIADIWEPRERGRAMSIFYLGPLLGPILAPVVGGILAQRLGWQSTMYFLAGYGAVVLLLLVFLLPETLARRGTTTTTPTDSVESRTSQPTKKTLAEQLATLTKRVLVDPLRVLLFLRFPPVLITVLVAAVAFGALFVANVAIQQKFSAPPYGFRQVVVGLLYVPPGLGYFVASFFGGRWIDAIMAREAVKANRYAEDGSLVYLPEDRMRENMWIANTLYPAGLLLLGWSLRYGVVWMVPSVGGFLFGLSSMLVFSAATTMLTEFVHKRSSAGVAVNNFVRNILSCVGTVVAAPWITAMDTGWVFTIIALFCLVSGYVGIWTLRRNAPRWRVELNEALKDM